MYLKNIKVYKLNVKDIFTIALKINNESYNEAFILINLDKVIQKIKLLMKENFFYKKQVLLDLIDIPKIYPLVQKYAALTQLIEDSNEIIIDKYGRTGHLINIGEYYLFQPQELNYKNISLFDRSIPIDFKHDFIKLFHLFNCLLLLNVFFILILV